MFSLPFAIWVRMFASVTEISRAGGSRRRNRPFNPGPTLVFSRSGWWHMRQFSSNTSRPTKAPKRQPRR